MKKYLLKTLSLLLCVILLLGILTACSSSEPTAELEKETSTPSSSEKAPESPAKEEPKEEAPAKKGTVTIMSSKDNWYPGFDEVCKQIEENHGISVELTLVDDGSYYDLMGVKLATGDAPDIFMANAPQYVEQFNAPTNCVALDDQPWVSRLADEAGLRYSGDGKIYAMPVYSARTFYGGIYYNKDVMEACGITDPNPATYEEFLEICQTVKDAGYIPIWMTDQDAWTTQVWTTVGWGVALDSKKDTIYDQLNSNQIDYQDIPELIDVLQRLQDLHTAGFCNEDHLSSAYETGFAALGENKAAMVVSGEFYVSACKQAYPDVNLGSFAIPFVDGQETIIGVGAFANGAYVPKGDNQELALEFLNLWSQPEQMALIYEVNGVASAFTDCEGGEMDPSVQKFVDEYIETGKCTREFDSYFDSSRPVMNDTLFNGIVECTAGSKTPEEVLTEYNVKFEQYMSEMEFEGF